MVEQDVCMMGNSIIVHRYIFTDAEKTMFRRMDQIPKHFKEQNRLNDYNITKNFAVFTGDDVVVAVGREYDEISRKDLDIVYVYLKRSY